MRGPRILHLRTVKGRGYLPAEKDPASWHAPGLFDPTTGIRSTGGSAPKWQDIFGQTLVDLARADSRVTAITAAMLSGTSVSMMAREFPDRTFDVGISEGHAVTFAGGLAKEGLRPFVAIYSSFLQRAYDHIIHDVAIQGLPVTFCIDRAGLVGEDGVTHHGVYDIAYLRNIPGMTVAAPRDASTLRRLMAAALLPERKGPMAIRYPRGAAPSDTEPSATNGQPIAIGRGEKLRHGSDVTLLSIGPIASEAARAIADAEVQGISTAHYDMIFAAPLDQEILHEIGRAGRPVITVEDGARAGGFGSAVIEWLADHGYLLPVTRIGIPDRFIPHGTVAELRHLAGMDAGAITEAIVAAAHSTR